MNRNSMRVLCNISGVIVFASAGRAIADDPKSPTPLSAAIIKAHKAIDKSKATTDLADGVVKASKAFDGVFLATVNKSKMEEKDGKAIIYGSLAVGRGAKDRYRTVDERLILENASKAVSLAKDAVNDAKPKIKRESMNNNEARVEEDQYAKEHRFKCEKRLAAAQSELRKAGIKVNAAADKRRKAAEEIKIELIVPKALRSKLDLDAMMLSEKLKLVTKVTGWKMGIEPEEIGGAPRLATLTLEVTGKAE
ncbi:MAG: hypothetical protein AABZ08_06990 [Planctomycetota bacterium]